MKLFARASASGPPVPVRLHIGCGQEAMKDWVNIDNKPLPGVDRVLDVTAGLPFENVSAIYAEHFLEHLPFDDGLRFLRECRRVLLPDGVLRLSTPNLDWVYLTHYRVGPPSEEAQPIRDCFQLNRAFHGWGHRFLYNGAMLEGALRDSGFETVRFQRYGQSDVAELSGLERHETWEDTADLPHVIIAEARGRGSSRPLPEKLLAEFREAIGAR